jgi:hypothetical protein
VRQDRGLLRQQNERVLESNVEEIARLCAGLLRQLEEIRVENERLAEQERVENQRRYL